MSSEPPSKKSRTHTGPDLVIHLDLNKTILAVDEVKQYGKAEVVYLEQWKNDEEFLKWTYRKHGPDFGDIFFGGKYAFRKDKAWKEDRPPQNKATLDIDGWIADLKLSKNEPTLIEYAQEYCRLDKGRYAAMEDVLSKIDDGNCVKSFWNLCDWAKQSDTNVLICFRTYGCDIPAMFDHIDSSGYGEHLVRDEATGRGQVWSILHKKDSEKGFGDWISDCDLVDGYIQPGNPVPGPKQKNTEGFKQRTVNFEEHAEELWNSGGALEPVIYTAAPEVSEQKIQAFTALQSEHIHPIQKLRELLGNVSFDTNSLQIMGIQDNYKPWSRKNPLNGKVAVLGSFSFRQLFFDDYSFTKGSAQGAYIWALYDAEGKPITGSKEELQAAYSAEEAFREQAADPCIFTVVLNKKDQDKTSVHDGNYFVARVEAAMQTK